MNITDYITFSIKPLSSNQTIKEAKLICNNYPTSHVIITRGNKLIGCLSESDIRTIEDDKKVIETQRIVTNHFHANRKSSLTELLFIFAKNDCNIIPVIDENQNYMGYYDLADILDLFVSLPFMHLDNESIIIQKNKRDYSISQIAQIIESTGSKLLGLYISHENNHTTEVTLTTKTNKINELLQTFRRYEYTIISSHTDDRYIEELKERAAYVKKYLDI